MNFKRSTLWMNMADTKEKSFDKSYFAEREKYRKIDWNIRVWMRMICTSSVYAESRLITIDLCLQFFGNIAKVQTMSSALVIQHAISPANNIFCTFWQVCYKPQGQSKSTFTISMLLLFSVSIGYLAMQHISYPVVEHWHAVKIQWDVLNFYLCNYF